MIPTRILVTLDESVASEAAVPYAEAIAAATGASITLFTVVEREATGLLGTPATAGAFLEDVRRQARAAILEAAAGALGARGVTVEMVITDGDPADEILAAADADPGAMIVMATHGRGGAERWLVGSVADKVMRMSTRPVLLVPAPASGVPAETAALRRLMVPLDGSVLAEAALPVARELARALHAEVVLVRVEPWIATAGGVAAYPDLGRMDEDAVALAETYLEDVRARLMEDIPTTIFVLRGAPADRLKDFALRRGVDLTVMTTHGRGGLRRLILGSTADRMVRADRPVLLIRSAATASLPGVEGAGRGGRRCATCGRLVSLAIAAGDRCPRCRAHLHACANCVFWDQFACVLQRGEAHDGAWAGRGCPRFIFRETEAPMAAVARG